MIFNSIEYLFFFPIVVIVYYLLPQQIKKVWLLAASYFFYLTCNTGYTILLMAVTLVTYGSAFGINKLKKLNYVKMTRILLIMTVFINVSLLGIFKYANFFIANLNKAMQITGVNKNIDALDIILPIGISFYIFQSLGYVFDVYRDKIKVEKNMVTYALFLAFFPLILAGPIERAGNLIPQLIKKQNFDIQKIRKGLLLILWGLFLKLVIADNIAPSVQMIYGAYDGYSGAEILVATVLFSIQIYCDFAGYSYMAIGSAQVLGFQFIDNFNAPYLAVSVSDFWKRWHISLTSWFRDYIYIPLGGSRKGRLIKYRNIAIIFLVSGFWHGASWSFLAWGALNGGLMILEELTVKWRQKLRSLLKIQENAYGYRLFQRISTFVLISFTWIFFRSNGLRSAFYLLKRMILAFQPGKMFGFVFENIGLSTQKMVVLLLAIALLFMVDYMKYKKKSVCEFVFAQDAWMRYVIYLGLLFFILVFGVYGMVYEQTSFIYFKF